MLETCLAKAVEPGFRIVFVCGGTWRHAHILFQHAMRLVGAKGLVPLKILRSVPSIAIGGVELRFVSVQQDESRTKGYPTGTLWYVDHAAWEIARR